MIILTRAYNLKLKPCTYLLRCKIHRCALLHSVYADAPIYVPIRPVQVIFRHIQDLSTKRCTYLHYMYIVMMCSAQSGIEPGASAFIQPGNESMYHCAVLASFINYCNYEVVSVIIIINFVYFTETWIALTIRRHTQRYRIPLTPIAAATAKGVEGNNNNPWLYMYMYMYMYIYYIVSPYSRFQPYVFIICTVHENLTSTYRVLLNVWGT